MSNYASFLKEKKTKESLKPLFRAITNGCYRDKTHPTNIGDKLIHREVISKPIKTFEEEPTNRSTRPRGSDGRFARKAPATPKRY